MGMLINNSSTINNQVPTEITTIPSLSTSKEEGAIHLRDMAPIKISGLHSGIGKCRQNLFLPIMMLSPRDRAMMREFKSHSMESPPDLKEVFTSNRMLPQLKQR